MEVSKLANAVIAESFSSVLKTTSSIVNFRNSLNFHVYVVGIVIRACTVNLDSRLHTQWLQQESFLIWSDMRPRAGEIAHSKLKTMQCYPLLFTRRHFKWTSTWRNVHLGQERLFLPCATPISGNSSLIFLDDTKVLICYEKSQFVCILLTFLLTLF